MKATRQLHDLRQSLWLDNTTRELLSSGTLKYCVDELSVTYPATASRIGWQEG
jgi:transaldolase